MIGKTISHYRILEKLGGGGKELTFEWLEKAYRDHSPWLRWLNVDPRFDSLHGDLRYRDLRRRMGLPP